jgi:hypothetical protein
LCHLDIKFDRCELAESVLSHRHADRYCGSAQPRSRLKRVLRLRLGSRQTGQSAFEERRHPPERQLRADSVEKVGGP